MKNPKVAKETKTRVEAKLATRNKLIACAFSILEEEGTSELSTGKVAKAAGIAQSSFYVHFKDMSELLHELGQSITKEVRASFKIDPHSLKNIRPNQFPIEPIFRACLNLTLNNPGFFKLSLRERHSSTSILGTYFRDLLVEMREVVFVEFAKLRPLDAPAFNDEELIVIVDYVIGATETLALGLLEGRYENVDFVIEMIGNSLSHYVDG